MVLDASAVHVWTHAVSDCSDAERALLEPSELQRASRFRFERDRRAYLATRVMIRQLLSRYANVPPKRWRFAANAFGRPRIAAPRPAQPLDFNLSHTSEHIVCAVAAVSDVGIDVESRVPDEFLAIARQFFSPSERRWLNDADAQESRDRFLTLWTLKEAYIKALGTGLSTPLDAFSVLPDKNDGALLLDDAPRPSGQRWYFKHWRLAADCRMAIAVRLPEGRAPDVTIRRF